MKRLVNLQQGASLLAVIFLLVVVAFLGTVVVSLVATQSFTSVNELQSTQAFYVAEAGLERAVNSFLSPTLASRTTCAGLPGAATSLNPGLFQLNIELGSPFYSNVPTTIPAGGVTAGATVIPAVSTVNYAPFGRIMVDREFIDYTGVTAASFTGAVRGRDGTIAAAHAAGTRVGQWQCTVTSTGGVIDLTAGARGRRVQRAGIQLQEGWMVGRTSGGESIVRWNGVNWTRSGPIGGIPDTDLYAVSMLSYAEGWIVGARSGGEVILRWTGGPNWARVGPNPAVPDEDLRGISCASTTECWAVGDRNGGEGLILRWNGGPNWVRFVAVPALPNTTLRSVHCVAPSDCWAVGDAAGGEVILRLTPGPTWTRLAPDAAIPNVDLYSVFCGAANDCWAVGDTSGGEVILRWNGVNWARVGPVAGVPDTLLRSVFCVSTTDCWAVGDRSGGNEVTIRWTGGPNWTRVGPSLPVPNVDLYSVSCVTSIDCWTTGSTAGGNEMLAHWDGAAWSRVGPLAGVPDVRLLGVAFLGAKWRPQAAWREVVN